MSDPAWTATQELAAAVDGYLEARDELTAAEEAEDKVLADYLTNAGASQEAEANRARAAERELLALARLRAAFRGWRKVA